ncbi:hypothetical protein IV500_06565 [Paeniglutamicibacter antarcticus]|uniref:Uncharacterized protein n=1 Tax=Arthrobacter terrae TaxID=2935737 RepID=A0A931G3U4_9MICC|nr:hypothetical protein [Arthrobacter terrae]MBG0739061.1 hypothetical protein [Arthrobacter terrae]
MNTSNWPDDSTSTTPKAKDEAKQVGREGAEAGAHVAQAAGAEAKNVAHTAGREAKNLIGELGDDLKSQAGAQQQKVAEGLRSISEELKGMAENNQQDAGTATHWVHEAARRTGDAAGWLDERDPGSLVDEVKRFARRRPGAFLAIAAGAGLLAGRLTRGLTGDSGGQTTSAAPQGGTSGSLRTTLPPAPYTSPSEPAKLPPTPEYHLASGSVAEASGTGGRAGTADAGLYESDASLDTYTGDDATIGYDAASGGVPPTVYPPVPGRVGENADDIADGDERRLP